jgi:hypothetical protein
MFYEIMLQDIRAEENISIKKRFWAGAIWE